MNITELGQNLVDMEEKVNTLILYINEEITRYESELKAMHDLIDSMHSQRKTALIHARIMAEALIRYGVEENA